MNFFKSSSKIVFRILVAETMKEIAFWTNMKRIEQFKKNDIAYFKECPPGYFDENCSKVCEYPTFGKRCANMCSCEKHSCSFLRGCTNGKYLLFYIRFWSIHFWYRVLNAVCNFNLKNVVTSICATMIN